MGGASADKGEHGLSPSLFSASGGDIASIAAEGRAWNARMVTGVLTFIGVLTLIGTALDGIPVMYSALIAAVAVINLFCYFLARRGHIVSAILLLCSAILAEHVGMVVSSGELTVIPFFATLVVLVASTSLRARSIWIVFVMAIVTVLIEGSLVGALDFGDTPERGTFTSALILLLFSSVIAWLYVAGIDRAFMLAEERERDRRTLLEALDKSQRMEALGRLAGGVAHDFNNLLVVMNGSAELAALDLPADHPSALELEHIREATERAAALTAQLLAFSRKQVMPSARAQPGDVVEGLRVLLPRLLGASVTLKVDILTSGRLVQLSATQLEQVLMNLVVNSRDAMMPSGGAITLRLDEVTLEDEEVDALPAGDYVVVEVEDEGSGISEEVRQHLFEPFYTTKEPGKGTGLGLATCFGIISQAGGAIEVESELGAGTTFRVYLPCSGDSLPIEAPRPESIVPRAALTMLVVDDDPHVLRIVSRVLESDGVEVLTASDSRSCMEAAEGAAQLDVIITDVVLGTEDGLDLLPKLRALHPLSNLVMMSGFTPDPARASELTRHGASFLAKPFTASQLLEATRPA